MIKAIDIKKFANFKEFEWKKNIGNYITNEEAVFKKNNIIYGRNYSGKTTFSRIIKTLEEKKLTDSFKETEFKILLSDESELSETNLKNDFIVAVYNSDFVKEKLSWFYNFEGEIEPFTILGKENKELTVEIKKLEKEIIDINISEKENQKNLAQKNYNTIENKINKTLTTEAREIKNRYSKPDYNKTKLENKLKSEKIKNFKKFTLEEIVNKQNILKDDKITSVEKIKFLIINFKELLSESNNLLQKRVEISEPIKELLENNLLQSWIGQGIEMHKNKEKCLFCGSNLTEEFWKTLNNHFNKESEDIIALLNIESKKIDHIINEISHRKDSLFELSGFSLNYKANIEILKNKLNLKYKKILNFLDELKIKLQQKKDNVTIALRCLELSFDENEFRNLEIELNHLIEENNKYIYDLEKIKKDIQEQLISNIEKEVFDKINYPKLQLEKEKNENILNEKEKEYIKAQKKVEEIKKYIGELELKKNNEEKAAKLINEYLKNYFGKIELKLISDNKKGEFTILRDNQKAEFLSEGECSIISFCYFLAKISDSIKEFNSKDKLIIYIDDPISSLDNNHIFNVFSLISKLIVEKGNYLQLFISTHNLEFLKYLKRLPFENEVKHFLIERKMKKNESSSLLSEMPDHLKKYTTEFHYLFSEIYNLAKECRRGDKGKYIENTYTTFYNMPNNMRKFLEYYLFFKYPNNETPLKNLEKLFNGNIPTKINRIVNEYSHLTFIDRGWAPMDVPEVEECAKLIINIVKEKDEEQYNALLNAIGEKSST